MSEAHIEVWYNSIH